MSFVKFTFHSELRRVRGNKPTKASEHTLLCLAAERLLPHVTKQRT
jgi:hypothetical protein